MRLHKAMEQFDPQKHECIALLGGRTFWDEGVLRWEATREPVLATKSNLESNQWYLISRKKVVDGYLRVYSNGQVYGREGEFIKLDTPDDGDANPGSYHQIHIGMGARRLTRNLLRNSKRRRENDIIGSSTTV